jgi:X-Pro dipeptidyl-peptidase (S15 family)
VRVYRLTGGRGKSVADSTDLPGRRALLRAGVLGGGTAAAFSAASSFLAAPQNALAADAATERASRPFELFSQQDLNFETLFTLGSAGYGAAEVGEVVTAVDEINRRGPSYQTYCDVFSALARRTVALADSQLSSGYKASARSAYLRGAAYWDCCLFFVLGTRQRAQEADVYARMQYSWNQAAMLFEPTFQSVQIPYAGTWLPGYFLACDSSPFPRPTVIINNGSDAQNIDLYVYGGAAALERGYNALIFEGPGQGSMLFERQIAYRPDWQDVITPIVDWLIARPDVDATRIALTGWSMCGCSVIQAAAHEHRLAAVVADPGVLDVWKAWRESIQKLLASGLPKAEVNHIWTTEFVPHITGDSKFTLAKRSELFGRQFLLAARAGRVFTDVYDLGKAIMKVNCAAAAPRVGCPTLVTAYQEDAFFGGHNQAAKVFSLLPEHIGKELHWFTVAEGAEYHDAPMAPQTRNQVIFDWLDRVLA